MPHYVKKSREQGVQKAVNKMWNDYECKVRPARCRSYPQLLNIAITDMCNLGCVHCPRTYDDSIDLDQLDVEEVKRIVDQVSPYTSQIQVSGGLGEPLLYDGIFDVIEYAKERNMEVYMISNGTLLDDHIDRIFEYDMDQLSISMEGATQEMYETVRVGSDYDAVLSNVKQLCERRDELDREKPIVRIAGVVLPEDNIEEIPDFVRLADDLGVDGLEFNDLIEPLEVEGITGETLQSTDVDRSHIEAQFERAREIAAERDLSLKLPGDEHYCDEPWKMLTVNTKGKVRPCCTGPYDLELHDVLEEDFGDIWNSDQFVEWRRQMLGDDPQDVCVDCQKPLH